MLAHGSPATDEVRAARERLAEPLSSRAFVPVMTATSFACTNRGGSKGFNLTLKWEWAYARPYASNTSRTEALQRWLHHYNYHRPHMAHAGGTPITVLNNVPRKHT
jgi:hypothetical protein